MSENQNQQVARSTKMWNWRILEDVDATYIIEADAPADDLSFARFAKSVICTINEAHPDAVANARGIVAVSNTLEALGSLFAEAIDAYNPEDSDQRRLRTSLLDAAEVLHANQCIDDGQFAIICESLNDDADDADDAALHELKRLEDIEHGRAVLEGDERA
jgi:hypothetical protein